MVNVTNHNLTGTIANQQYETVNINDGRLTLHPRNPNTGDIGAIAESINANGFAGAILAQQTTGHIVAGNHRYIAAQQLGMTEVPVIWLNITDNQALRLLVADNELTRKGTFHEDQLTMVLAELASHNELEGSGFDGDDLDDLLNKLNEDDTKPPTPPSYRIALTFPNAEERDQAMRDLQDAGYACKAN